MMTRMTPSNEATDKQANKTQPTTRSREQIQKEEGLMRQSLQRSNPDRRTTQRYNGGIVHRLHINQLRYPVVHRQAYKHEGLVHFHATIHHQSSEVEL